MDSDMLQRQASIWAEELAVELTGKEPITDAQAKRILKRLVGGSKPTEDQREAFTMAMGSIGLRPERYEVWIQLDEERLAKQARREALREAERRKIPERRPIDMANPPKKPNPIPKT